METEEIIKVVEDNYNINATVVEERKNIIKIKDKNKCYCLKIIKYNFGHFLFILEAINHLIRNDFQFISQFIKTKDNKQYIKLNNSYAYLIPWIEGRHSNYNNEKELRAVTEKLADFHIKSRNFQIESNFNPRIAWFKWIETFETRKNEILDFKRRINEKSNKSEFDYLYLSIMEKEIKRANNSIEKLKKSNYMKSMEKEFRFKGFCHHDMANHNVLIKENGEIYFIDFDYCILDTHLHDVSSLLIRNMKYGNWDVKKAAEIMSWYNFIYPFNEEDIEIMVAFIEFPQDYWQRGIQYYWEKKPWGEEFFINKLTKYINDIERRGKFIDEFGHKKICQII